MNVNWGNIFLCTLVGLLLSFISVLFCLIAFVLWSIHPALAGIVMLGAVTGFIVGYSW